MADKPGPAVLRESLFSQQYDSDADGLDLSDDDDVQDPTYRPQLISDDDDDQLSDQDETIILHIEDVDVIDKQESQGPKRKKRKSNYIWNAVARNQLSKDSPTFLEATIDEDDEILSPVNYFRKFFSCEFLDEIVHQCNIYAVQKNPNKPFNLTKDELEQWMGISMKMSLTRISDTRQHWSSECLTESIGAIMSRQRWEDIKSNFHLVDNETVDKNDKIAKVRMMVDHLRAEFKQIPMTEHLSIDEQMVPFKGASSLKQYIPKKPIKWGYKLFVLADHKGMIYDFFPYEGKIHPVSREGVPDLGASANSDDKKLANEGRGSFDEHETDSGGTTVTALKWYDNRAVCLASSFATSVPIEQARKYDKKSKDYVDVPIPHIVRMYNEHMGGVDLHDQLLSYYRMSFRSKRYYMRLVFHMIDITVINCWLLYRRAADKADIPMRKQNSLSHFKLRLSKSLMIAGKQMNPAKRGRPSSVVKAFKDRKMKGKATKPIPEENVRLDGVDHLPDYAEVRGTCKMPGCTARVLVFCHKCNVHLCFERSRNCFKKFHTE
ncbi:piggyBac transposable element-derived protein 2-like [Penaeus monodon]|uniref:piggyBac transposable element-derived protein 2-like n=1 Tax=Penaeus monodon TaxID=6687 RepID=UPI0018A77B8C|nr:piggyBac transposable element-derived protein 2-like [Penaeus monodon]